MKKVCQYRGFVIATEPKEEPPIFYIFTRLEYEYGPGLRYHEWESTQIEEAKEFIDNWRKEQ